MHLAWQIPSAIRTLPNRESQFCENAAYYGLPAEGGAMEITQIPVERILLDMRNPRIAHAMEGIAGTVNQDWITLALGHAAPEDEERGTSTTYSSRRHPAMGPWLHSLLFFCLFVTPDVTLTKMIPLQNTAKCW
jgi:hypothetical protein